MEIYKNPTLNLKTEQQIPQKPQQQYFVDDFDVNE